MTRAALVCFAALAIVGCENAASTTIPARARASLAQTTTRTKLEQWIPLSLSTENPCTGEAITISGREHLVQTLVSDGTTGNVSVHINADDLSGVGASGAAYHINLAAQRFFIERRLPP